MSDSSCGTPGISATDSKPSVEDEPSQTDVTLDYSDALRMIESFDRKYHDTYRTNFFDVQRQIIRRMNSIVSSFSSDGILVQSNSPSKQTVDRNKLLLNHQDMIDYLVCMRSASRASRDIAAQEAAVIFEKIKKNRPLVQKAKRGKGNKKEKKEKELPSSTKADRTVQREKPGTSKIAEYVHETPIAVSRGKRRAITTSEKKPKKENGIKKRTSNRLSKTPRVKTKEEDEPTYCFCSRISFGDMIGCDNEKCEIEWFHFECIGLTTKPKGKWFCPNCRHPDSARMPKAAKSNNRDKE